MQVKTIDKNQLSTISETLRVQEIHHMFYLHVLSKKIIFITSYQYNILYSIIYYRQQLNFITSLFIHLILLFLRSLSLLLELLLSADPSLKHDSISIILTPTVTRN